MTVEEMLQSLTDAIVTKMDEGTPEAEVEVEPAAVVDEVVDDVEKASKDEVDAMKETIGSLKEKLTDAEAKLEDMTKALDADRDALAKAFDRIEGLEKGSAVRTGAEGQEALEKAEGGKWDGLVKGALAGKTVEMR